MIGFVQITGLDKRGKFRHQNIRSPTTSSSQSSSENTNEEKADASDKTFEKYMDGVLTTHHYVYIEICNNRDQRFIY